MSMKRIYFLLIVAWITGILFGLSSCQQEVICPVYLNLDKTLYTFGPEGGTVTVKVDANTNWSVNQEGDWFTCETDVDQLVVVATANDGQERAGNVTFLAEGLDPVILSLSQLNREFEGQIIYIPSNVMMKYSPRGRYALKIEQIEGTMLPTFGVYLVNNESGEARRLEDLEAQLRSPASELVAVSDEGHILISSMTDGTASVYLDGNSTMIEIPGEYGSFTLTGISSDGTTVVGTARRNEAPRPYVPFRWSDNTFEELLLPEKDMFDNPLTGGAKIGGMSADGSVIWGYDNQSLNYSGIEGLIYWKGEDVHYIGAESAEIKTYMQYDKEYQTVCLVRKQGTASSGPKISCNGKYILAEYYDVVINDGQKGEESYYPVLVDTETGEYKIFDNQKDMCSFTVDEDGYVFGASPYFSASYVAKDGIVLSPDGSSGSLSDYFRNKYGIALSNTMLMYHYIPDRHQYLGKKLTGTSMYGGIYQHFTLFVD